MSRETGGFDLSLVVRMLFSCLVDADCRDTEAFYAGIETDGLEIEELPELADLELQLGGRSFSYSIVRTRLPGQGPAIHLLRCPELYFRREIYSGPDEHLRFILLSRAAIEMCQRMQFAPDIFHCHDWHTALVPVYLKTRYAWDQLFANTHTVLTIHNIGYQGVFGAGILYEMGLSSSPEVLDPEDLHYDRINFLKSGIIHADLLTTVSPTHAREILEPGYGMGLDGWLRGRSGSLIGILNGVDYAEWSPRTDEHIPHHYSAGRMAGKERNKQAVMHELGLDYQFDRPLVGMVTRLTYQKGIDLVQEVLPDLLKSRDFSLAVLGGGEAHHERFFHWLHAQFAGRVSFYQGFNNPLAHRIEAGADIFLMPSRYEPCGLNQMMSLRYGTVPVVHRVGGLADTLRAVGDDPENGLGFVFDGYTPEAMTAALGRALAAYADPVRWRAMQRRGMAEDFTWDRSALRYESVYAGALARVRARDGRPE